MKIALIGYGKMGQAIESIAIAKGHTIVLKISLENLADNTIENIRKADVAIEFTGPESAFKNISKCLEAGVPVVSGSTGWLTDFDKAVALTKTTNTALLYASNFSIGVNLFFELNKQLAKLMAPYQNYDVSMEEIHHTQKKDAPSGTAITLAEQIIDTIPSKKSWENEAVSTDSNKLNIVSARIDPAPGTHKIAYNSPIDTIEIIHTAHNRTGFASGAVLAAEFLNQHRNGVWQMKDVLGI